MRNNQGYSPKEAAFDIAIGWLKAAHDQITGDVARYSNTPAFERALLPQIAKLHNRLLEQSKLDGLPLGVSNDNT